MARFMVKMYQNLFEQEVLNTFFYDEILISGIDDADDLAAAFDATILSQWKNCVTAAITVTNLEVFQISLPSNYSATVPVNFQGTRPDVVAQRAPGWVAFSYKSNRNGAGTRSSFKRFAGLDENDFQGNVLSPAFLAIPEVTTLQNAMALPLNGSGGSVWLPIQIKRPFTLGVTAGINFFITNWFTPTLSSQVSRKP